MSGRASVACPGLLALILCLAACPGCGPGIAPIAAEPDSATVQKAASMAFGTRATCAKPDQYWQYACTEHPATCNVPNDGYLDSVPDAGCWQTTCDVELGVQVGHGESGTRDFYYCERDLIGCSSMTGGCPSDAVCITGRNGALAVDEQRTLALPGSTSAGAEFTCPYHDEG